MDQSEFVHAAAAVLNVRPREGESEAEFARRVRLAATQSSPGGSLLAIETAVDVAIHEVRPAASSLAEVQLNLAVRWLGHHAPRGLFRRLRYFWRLFRSAWAWLPVALALLGCSTASRLAAHTFGPCCDLGGTALRCPALSGEHDWACFPGESATVQDCGDGECPVGAICRDGDDNQGEVRPCAEVE